MDIYLQQFINWLVLGSMYALVAIGFTLYFGVLRVIHFAQGEIYMLGAFSFMITYSLLSRINMPMWFVVALSFFSAVIFCSILGVLIERIAFKPFRNASPLACLVSSLGFSILLREAVLVFIPDGANPKPFPELISGEPMYFLGIIITWNKILLILISLFSILTVSFIVRNTIYGKAIRAISLDSEAAEMQGINVDIIIVFTFIIGSVLAVIAGILSGANYGSVKYDMGFTAGIKGFTAAVFGGLGKLEGALLGGFVLAFLEIITIISFDNSSGYKDAIAFLILIFTLTFLPTGILSSKIVTRS